MIKDKNSVKKYFGDLFLSTLLLVFFIVCIHLNFSIRAEQQFSYLADSFLNGKTYFLEIPGSYGDLVYWMGRYYWPLSPLPAVMLAPFTLISQFLGERFYQGFLQIILTITIFFICFVFARKKGFANRDSIVLAISFCFASIYQMVAVMPWSWYFVQVFCVLFTFLAIFEWTTSKRWWIIGILMALAFTARATSGIGLIFFIMVIWFEKTTWKKKLYQLLTLCFPVLCFILILAGYNFIRFNDPFNNGYILTNNSLFSESERYELLNHGLFKISNIPTNFYYFVIKTLEPVQENVVSAFGNTHILRWPYIKVGYPGTSFFVVSPVFLLIFKTWSKLREREIRLLWLTVGTIFIILLTYYWSGWRQVGPRYLIDLLPWVYLLFLSSFEQKRLSLSIKVIIIGSAFFNLYLLSTVFFYNFR